MSETRRPRVSLSLQALQEMKQQAEQLSQYYPDRPVFSPRDVLALFKIIDADATSEAAPPQPLELDVPLLEETRRPRRRWWLRRSPDYGHVLGDDCPCGPSCDGSGPMIASTNLTPTERAEWRKEALPAVESDYANWHDATAERRILILLDALRDERTARDEAKAARKELAAAVIKWQDRHDECHVRAERAEAERDEWKDCAENSYAWKIKADLHKAEQSRDSWHDKAVAELVRAEKAEAAREEAERDRAMEESYGNHARDRVEALESDLADMTRQRDEAQRDAARYRSESIEMEEAWERATERAVIAEQCGHPNHGASDHDCAPFTAEQENAQCMRAEAAERELADLRARIGALADRWHGYGRTAPSDQDARRWWSVEGTIRSLLSPTDPTDEQHEAPQKPPC